jgi:hypothetical protein
MSRRRALAGLPALALLAGCASCASNAPAATDDWGPLTVVEDPQGGMDALATGVLDVAEDCVYLRMDDGEPLLLVWPDARTSWDGDERTITFLGADGPFTAADEAEVAVGGGFGAVPEDELVAGAPDSCESDEFWWVSALGAP